MHLPKCCNAKLFLILTIIFVALFIVSLVLTFKIFPDVIDDEIKKSTQLKEGTEQYDRFLELPFPMQFSTYIFNIENPDDILAGSKPIVREIGPYVYNQYRKKTIDSKDSEEDTISYRQMQTYEFDPDASGSADNPLSDEDMVTVLNPPMLGILQIAEDMGLSSLIGNCIQEAFPEPYNRLFITIKVKDILFNGLNFCIIKTGKCQVFNTLACRQAAGKRNIDQLEDGTLKFSFFNYKARSDDGLYTIKRGLHDISTLGHITGLNGASHTEIWNGVGSQTTCDEVKGGDSTIYPPHIDTDSVFQIYSTDICRYINIDYIKEATYRDTDGYMFGTNETTLFASTEVVEEDCFCSLKTSMPDGNKGCFLDGVVDLQPCTGVPVLLSFPHFLWANEQYQTGVDGLSPNVDLHRIFLIVEPNTGTPLRGAKRIQMSMVLRPVTGSTMTTPLMRTVLPMIWIEEGVSLTTKYIDELNDKYFSKKMLVDVIQWVLVGVTAALSIGFGAVFVRKQFFK